MERNILLIVLDTVRKDAFDRYATRLQDLADVSFEQCRTVSGNTPPSHASMFTGALPYEHQIVSVRTDFGMIADECFFTDMDGYTSIGLSANPWLAPDFGFDEIFDQFKTISPYRRFNDGIDVRRFVANSEETGFKRYFSFVSEFLHNKNRIKSISNGISTYLFELFKSSRFPSPIDGGASILSREIKKATEETQEPYVLFANFMDAHGPMYPVRGYDSDIASVPGSWRMDNVDIDPLLFDQSPETVDEYEEFLDSYRSLYAASIEYLDRRVTETIEHVQSNSDRPVTTIITSDHGENLAYPGDEYLFQHYSSLSESITHVPCYIVNPPSGYDAQEMEYVTQARFGDLIRGLAAGETPDVFDQSIVTEMPGHYGALEYDSEKGIDYWSRAIRCAYRGTTKYEWDSLGNSRRIDLGASSRNELVFESDIELPEWASEPFTDEMLVIGSEQSSKTGIDDIENNTQSRLEDLGYL